MPNFDNLFNAWLPLFFENSKNNGTMTIIDKSHLSGRLPYTRMDKPGGFCDLVTNVEKFDLEKSIDWSLAIVINLNKFSARLVNQHHF